jgi:phage terminase large subunit-like protein
MTAKPKKLFTDEGERAIGFIEQLWIQPSGQKLQRFKLLDWQKTVIRDVFGTINTATGLRRFTEAIVAMGKKNGKSGLLSALIVYALFVGFPAGSEIYSIAASKDQAAILWKESVNIITNTPGLRDRVHSSFQFKTIEVRKGKTKGSKYEALSAEKDTVHGKKPAFLIVDEAALVDADLWLALEQSMSTQPEPLQFAISHATSLNREHIYQQKLVTARKVKAGSINIEHLYVALWELPLNEDWRDEKNWYKANPSLGTIKSLEAMRRTFQQAIRTPAFATRFRQWDLNQFTESDETWLFDKDVNACAMPDDPKAVLERFKGRPCFVGLDLSSVEDLTCACLFFPKQGQEKGPTAFFAFFHPKDGHEQRSEKDAVNYGVWSEQGFITLTDGRTVDYEVVRSVIKKWSEDYRVIQIGYDKRFAADLIKRLSEIDGFDCVDIGQGFAHLTSPSQAVEKEVLNHTLQHDNNPILLWNFANCCVARGHGDEIFPSKMRSNGRIDGVLALVMAQYCLERNPDIPDGSSVYDDPNIAYYL